MNRTLIRSIYRRFFVKITHFVAIRYQTWPPQAFLFLIGWFLLAKRFQRWRFFRNRSIRNNNCLWRPCLLMDWDNICNRGPSIDDSYQVSVHLAERFQRRRLKCEKLTDDGWRITDDGHQVMAKDHITYIFHGIFIETPPWLKSQVAMNFAVLR
jgi:hypothetical protein